MTNFLRPIASALIGLALTVYGLIYSITGFPGAAPFTVLWSSLPALFTVGLFLLGLGAVVIGLILTVTGLQSARRRCRQIGQAFGGARGPVNDAREPEYDEDDERYWHPRGAYR